MPPILEGGNFSEMLGLVGSGFSVVRYVSFRAQCLWRRVPGPLKIAQDGISVGTPIARIALVWRASFSGMARSHQDVSSVMECGC